MARNQERQKIHLEFPLYPERYFCPGQCTQIPTEIKEEMKKFQYDMMRGPFRIVLSNL